MYEILPFGRRGRVIKAMDPFAMMDEMEKAFSYGRSAVSSYLGFKTDVKDNGDGYVLEAELPGFDKEDIKVEVEDDILTISAERKSDSEEKDDEGSYVRRERSRGSYSRSFDISNVNQDEIKVKYENGILTIDLPKKDEDKPKKKSFDIE
ncbi:MAG: Hsp20/alpha crystallin family protein [Coriobacteriales bacterium]|jgi:HSP20 family protein